MRTLLRGLLFTAALVAAGTAVAKDKEEGASFGVSVEASTMGAGLSLGIPLGQRFSVRGAYHGFTYDLDDIEDDSGATYEGELELKSAGLLIDFHPFNGAFRLTAGFASNGNQINLAGIASPGSTYEVGSCTYESDPADPLRIDGTVEFASTAPYVGIGWGGHMASAPGFFMTFDLGVLMSGSPDTQIEGRGSARNTNAAEIAQCGPTTYQDVSGTPQFQQAVQDAEDEVNEDTKDYEYWPNFALGVGWRF